MSGKSCIFAPANGQHTLQHEDDILLTAQKDELGRAFQGLSQELHEHASKK